MVNWIYYLLIAQFATLATHFLALKWGAVRASTAVTLFFIGLTTPIPSPLIPTLHGLCLGATFVGMSDPKRLSAKALSLASFAYVLFFEFFIHHFTGLGGALGFSAFVACVFTFGLLHFTKRLRLKAIPPTT